MILNRNFDMENSRKLLLGELSAKNARKFAHKEAIVFGNKRFTWEEFDARVNRLSNALIDMGVNRGDKVAVLFYNCSELLECYMAIAKAGAVSVPINFRLAPREMEYILNNSDSQVLVFDHRFLPSIKQIMTSLPLMNRYVIVGAESGEMEEYENLLVRFSPIRPEVAVEDEDEAMILYTSGTTGRPKGAVLTHKNFMMNAMTAAFEMGLKADESQVCVAPLFHTAAIIAVLFHFYIGGKTVIHENFNPADVMDAIDNERVSYVFMVPAMWLAVLQLPDLDQYNCDFLRIAGTGGAIMPIDVKKRIMKQFPNVGIFDTFGQTEMSPCTTTLKPEFAELKQGSVGQAFTLVECRVVDHEGNDVPLGAIGEIVYRGPNMMKGYYKDIEATAEAFKGGWFHSGDLVRMDEEEFFYVVDRKKDMIISGGENVYPAEIEEILFSHPKILEAAVIGISDEKWGETVKALVVVRPGQAMTAEELVDFCGLHLARYKLPRSIEFVDALPRNASGKVLKTELRKRYGNSIKY